MPLAALFSIDTGLAYDCPSVWRWRVRGGLRRRRHRGTCTRRNSYSYLIVGQKSEKDRGKNAETERKVKREICKTFNQFSFLLNLTNQSKMTAPTKEAAMDTTAHSGTSDDPLADGNAGGLGGERGVDDDGNTGTAATPQNNVAGKNSNEQHSFAACFSLASSAADSSPSGSPAESTIFSATTGGAVGGGDDGASTVMTGGGGGGGGVSLFGNDDDDGDDEEMEYNDDDNRGQEFSRNPNGAEGGGSSNSIAAMQVARRITLAGDGIMMESSDNNGSNGNNTTTFTANTSNNAGAARDDYVRSAARFRSLVGSALRRVADGFGTTAKSSNSKKNVHVGGAGSPSLQIATTATSVSGYKRSRALGGGGGGNSAEDDDDSSGGSFLSPGGGGGGGDTSSRGVRRRKLLGGGSGTCGGLGGRDYAADLAREKAVEVLVLQRVSG